MNRSINNFRQAELLLEKFINLNTFESNYTLERMKKLMKFIGDPQENIKIIHVAGTSGKTSTSYYIASLLKEAGYSVGMTTSPHLSVVNERFQINLIPLSEEEFCKELSQFLEIIDESRLKPMYFELLVAFAYWIFNKKNVDFAVIEVGLGGLLDGTNVVNQPDKTCVITDIGLDHVEVLGNTIEKITLQKAGIIKNGNTVFVNQQSDLVISIIKNVCSKKNATLNIVDNSKAYEKDMVLLPTFQKRNFRLAKKTVEYVLGRDKNLILTKKIIKLALKVKIPGRMEIINYKNKTYILDGSHNEQKINGLVTAIKERFKDDIVCMLVSFGNNKRPGVIESLKVLRELGPSIIVTGFGTAQSKRISCIEPEELGKYAKLANFDSVTIENNPIAALQSLDSRNESIYLITGSFYLLKSIKNYINKTD